MIYSGVTIGITKEDGTQIRIAIDPADTNKAENKTNNNGTYKLYHDIDSPKMFDKGYMGALFLDDTDKGYNYSGGKELTDFELKQLVLFIRDFQSTGNNTDDHNRGISSK